MPKAFPSEGKVARNEPDEVDTQKSVVGGVDPDAPNELTLRVMNYPKGRELTAS